MATERRLVTYLDIDPVIQYSPSLDDTAGTLGWLTSFPATQTPVLGPADFAYGVGDSRRITGSAGASLQFQFYGSSASLYGSALNVRYNVQVDTQPAKELVESAGVLASITGLEPALHTVKLTVLETRGFTLSFDRVEFDIGMRGDWTNSTYPGRVGSPGWTYTDDAKSPWVNLTNKWSDGSGRTQDCVFTHALGGKASLKFTGSAVYIWGNTLADHGRFKVTLSSPDQPESTAIYQGRTKFTTVEALMYFQGGLDSSKTHTLTIENFDDVYLDVVRAIVATGEERHPSSGSKTNIGAIVGGAVGGVAFLLALIALIIVILRRRRQNNEYRHEDAHRTNWDVPAGTGTVSPFSPPSVVGVVPGSQGHHQSQTASFVSQQHGPLMQQAQYPAAGSYVSGSGSGSSDVGQRVGQAYFGPSSYAPSAQSAASPSAAMSPKQAMMMQQHQRVTGVAEEVVPPAYSERPR